jgi:hypothetical protein
MSSVNELADDMAAEAAPQLRSLLLSGRQYFISVHLTAEGGLDVSLTDGAAGWRGSLSSAQLTRPQHMSAAEFRSRLVERLLANGPSAARNQLTLLTSSPHLHELEWKATIRLPGTLGLEMSLRQVRACRASLWLPRPCGSRLQIAPPPAS